MRCDAVQHRHRCPRAGTTRASPSRRAAQGQPRGFRVARRSACGRSRTWRCYHNWTHSSSRKAVLHADHSSSAARAALAIAASRVRRDRVRAGAVSVEARPRHRACCRGRRHRHGISHHRPILVGRCSEQPVVIENKPGARAGRSAATTSRSRSPTVTRCSAPACRSPSTRRSAASCPTMRFSDFTPLSLVVVTPAAPDRRASDRCRSKDMRGASRLRKGAAGAAAIHDGRNRQLWSPVVGDVPRQAGRGRASTCRTTASRRRFKDAVGGQVPVLIDAIVPTGAQVQGGHGSRHRDRQCATLQIAA